MLSPTPFTSPDLKNGDPLLSWKDFKRPRLRRFSPPSNFQLECINCALLDMIGASLRRAKTTANPIRLRPNPTKHKHAIRNLFAFSDEGYAKSPPPEHFVPFEPSVEINRCIGWTELSGRDINAALRRAWVHQDIDDNQTYFAIVYSFVPKAKLKAETIISQLEFFHITGFYNVSSDFTNWLGAGVLVDFCDIVHPFAQELEWSEHWYAKNPSMLHAAVRYQAQEGIL
ncbi:hypothetical protein B0J15DRAFT_579717 [Fusarium solani]|uniref:Uncharacterized protein n=1 Tax=Fusarium solani TaxID=169388 RepID=A0A9P9HXT1_FUSSL|nr:uncharacterized protein B0J15DRAFT_579717 [Fusarium solani]KAH7265819.1 hypothetical protein B0J15DRAFT_579717 [Fusarium solani]